MDLEWLLPSSFSRRRWPANKKKQKQSSGSFSFFQICFSTLFFSNLFHRISFFGLHLHLLRFRSLAYDQRRLATGLISRRCKWMGTGSVLLSEGEWEGISSSWRVIGGRPIWVCGHRRARAASGRGDGGLWAGGGNDCWAGRLSCGGLVYEGKRIDLVRREARPVLRGGSGWGETRVL